MSEPTRRDFLKTSSAAVVLGTGLLSSISSRAYADGSDEIKIGLVGCGGRGSGAAAQALSTKGKVKLVSMGDAFQDAIDNSLRNIQKAVSGVPDAEVDVEKSRQFVGFDAYKQVIDSGVDLVILATPPGLRPIHFEYAVAQGKNIFMEKPVATDAPGVQRVLDASRKAKEKGLKVGVGLQRHHQKPYLDMVKRIHDGELGDVRALRVYWNSAGVWEPRLKREDAKSEMEYQVRNWYYYNWLSGDHIVEQHIHNLDVGNWIMKGYPVSCNGMGGREVRKDPKYGDIFDHHACEFTYEDGTVMMSQCRHIKNCWNPVSEHVHTTKGIIDLGPSFRVSLFGNDKPERIREEGGNPYQVEHDDLFAAIRAGQPYTEADNGAMSTMTAILGRMCSYSGKVIKMEDALAKGLDIMPKEYSWEATPPVVPGPDGAYPVPVPGVTQVLKS
ncbi:Gfo/Idh/MocA family oxidoreductase [Planctomicrobium piriforme]|uniref:Tat (Twin-arginine translocation) pathway signal sequence n=1 Tax=Planctomicrobium piriforme TaxID=1576369 RepID=A0A1I3NQK0_9PLAN|nr:Gfo/Idh/MocA family oxidoreductase [Planctomicrobium piriforme]SFJ11545.1 Tat (twin-arginine translocation) pathway signal sequence [Planctomicrobium piriforme]